MLIPAILFFALGFLAQRVHPDLKFPSDLAKARSIYLLVVIGLHGGMELAKIDPVDAIGAIVAALGLGFGLPIVANAALEGGSNILFMLIVAAAKLDEVLVDIEKLMKRGHHLTVFITGTQVLRREKFSS